MPVMPHKSGPWEGYSDPLFVLMCQWDERLQQVRLDHRERVPPYGSLGIGSADMPYFFQQVAIEEFLWGIRRGNTLADAEKRSRAALWEVVEKWNKQGCKSRCCINSSHELHYWKDTEQDLIDTMVRAFTKLPAGALPYKPKDTWKTAVK